MARRAIWLVARNQNSPLHRQAIVTRTTRRSGSRTIDRIERLMTAGTRQLS